MGRLDGKVTVITGAASGIARGAAAAFVREGAIVGVSAVMMASGEAAGMRRRRQMAGGGPPASERLRRPAAERRASSP